MRYRLRTLLILLAVGPPVLAGAWWAWRFNRPSFDPASLTGAEREAYWKSVDESMRHEEKEREELRLMGRGLASSASD